MYEQPFNPFSNNIAIVKGYFKSPAVLTAAILRLAAIFMPIGISLYATLNLPAILTSLRTVILESMTELQRALGMPNDLIEYIMSEFDKSGFSINVSFSSAGIPILICVAYFLIYFKSRSEVPEASPKAGFTILYVLSVISLIMMIISTVIVVGACVLLIIYCVYSASNMTNEIVTLDLSPTLSVDVESVILIGLGIGFSVFAIIAVVYALLAAISAKRYYGSVRTSLSSFELQNRGAGFYGVICIINAIATLLGVAASVSLITGSGSIHFSGPLMVLAILNCASSLISCAILIIDAKIAFGYKKYIDDIKNSYNRPVPPASPYSPISFSQPQPGYRPYSGGTYNSNPYADPYGSAPAGSAAPRSASGAICPHCGANADLSAPFCGNCGKSL